MKNFALLNEQNTVINISVADDNWDSTGWIEYTDRKCGIGYSYDVVADVFIPPQPFLSWTLNYITYDWESPIPYPDDEKSYSWNEKDLTWDLVND